MVGYIEVLKGANKEYITQSDKAHVIGVLETVAKSLGWL